MAQISLRVLCVSSLLFGLWLGFGSKSIGPIATSAIAEAVAAPASTPKYKTVAIREIQPAGYKVLADNPQTRGQAAGDFGEFDPKKWQVHRFVMNKPDGGWLKIGLARPMAWIESVERSDSGQVWLEFEELGIADWATLQATEPCPTNILGEGRLVTGTFEHSSGEVLNLFIAGEATPIGSTANHPFWSEDRQDFVQAGSLEPGEHLRLADGRTTTLERTEPSAEQLPVYNLEVDGEHVYFVGESGVLVHNAGDAYPWNSVKKFGHTFNTHGAGPKNLKNLAGRAGGTGQIQGQWLDNAKAADFLQRIGQIDGPLTTRIPKGLGQLIHPDGTISPAEWARIVPRGSGFNSAFPVPGGP